MDCEGDVGKPTASKWVIDKGDHNCDRLSMLEWRYLKFIIILFALAEGPRDTYSDRWISSAEGSTVWA